MPWITDELETLVSRVKALVNRSLGVLPGSAVVLCSRDEMTRRVAPEIRSMNLSREKIVYLIKHVVPFIAGKFFTATKEIWLVEEEGDNLMVLLHELLHSIQECSPHREGIVEYITYKLTGNSEMINPFILNDWEEIENNVGFDRIKKRLLHEGDCEELQ